MNSMNDSGEFQEVEWNHSGKISHVSSQLARIPSERAMPSCDRRLPLDTWHRSGSQENVFANPRSTFESSQTPCRGIHHFATSSAAGEACGKRGRTNWKHNPNADICKKAADHERLYASGYSTEVLWVDSKDSRYRNFNLIKALLHHHFNVG